MNYLQMLGIPNTIKSFIYIGIISLILLGLATNAIFELSHVLDNGTFKPFSFWINIGYLFVFICWILLLRRASTQKQFSPLIQKPKEGKHYKGIVLILSKPRDKTPQNINDAIKSADTKDANNLDSLYGIQSIGQLFKGIYEHRDNLNFIWPIVTDETKPFRECIENFIKKYCSKAKLADSKGSGEDYCLLPKCNEGTEMINNVKRAVTAIYSEDNLDIFGLKKQDVVLDMSGGTKTMTIGAVFGAIDEEIDIQYVEQTLNRLISVSITPVNILDKFAEYLLRVVDDTKKTQKSSKKDNE